MNTRTGCLAACLLIASGPGLAGPGAHGPGGEHLDNAGSAVHSGSGSVPRLEAKSEIFELVARIEPGAVTAFVDRHDTNEPVLGASLEIEVGTLKRQAVFRREQGDYAVVDAEIVKRLSAPGSHALVFTITAGKESDLLEGALHVGVAGAGNGGAYPLARYGGLAGALAAALLAIAGIVAIRRRRVAAAALPWSRP
jgi:hypothetical protein